MVLVRSGGPGSVRWPWFGPVALVRSGGPGSVPRSREKVRTEGPGAEVPRSGPRLL